MLIHLLSTVLDFAAITRKNEPIDSTFGRYIEEIEKWVYAVVIHVS